MSTRAAAHSISYAIWLKTIKKGGQSHPLDKSYDDFLERVIMEAAGTPPALQISLNFLDRRAAALKSL